MKKLSSPEFHNALASDYDQTMAIKPENEIVRQQVAEYFCRIVTGDSVMDFGGGTGLDLPWLIEHQYSIWFCEPAEGMRSIARNKHLDSEQIVFLDDHICDFTTWSPDNLPTNDSYDGILANFAVINCIENIDILFKKFAMIVASGTHVIGLVLDGRPIKLLMKYKRQIWKSMVNNKKIIISSAYKNLTHTAFLHTPNYLQKCSSPYFDLVFSKPLNGTDFLLVDFKRNDFNIYR